ncbi:RloB family protein [Magnetospirillum sp. UT-4]|uniref:RloB family protein n=1 Tax=Magnetospirillum sp. UT-4 TaxID=2681467 RepID=UPI0013809C0A|nr:RloB family protein [Magnetospirillum sp. UT-4]CAA7626441.1 RloB-like protein [Magnetospirillum sp. UT-4]
MARRLPEPKRRLPSRDPKVRFILYCEGKNTEPAYFAAVKRLHAGALVEVITEPAAGVPLTIAQKAADHAKALQRSKKDSFEKGDRIWAVFDVDAHPNFAQAVALCQAANVKVARSNPCFEVWLILHHQDFHKPDHRHDVQRHFATLAPGYDPERGKLPDCKAMMKDIDDAERRAEKQLQARADQGDPFGPPSTTVQELTRAIREAADSSRRKP